MIAGYILEVPHPAWLRHVARPLTPQLSVRFDCRRRLGALLNELGVFVGEGRLEELFDRMARLVAIFDGAWVPSQRHSARLG